MGTRVAEEDRVFASWHITNYCNYDCDYCFGHETAHIKTRLPVEKIINTLVKTGKKWCIGMTGGEPFIYPNFIDVCQAFNNNDILIALDTNLSIRPKVKAFAETIDPYNVHYLYVSTHIEEREKYGEVEHFIEDLLLLKEKGFHTLVNYVLHPRLIEKFKQDHEYFLSFGIELFAKPFRGFFNNKKYPEAYSEATKSLILETDPNAFKYSPFPSKDVLCKAGQNMVRINVDGVVTRCVADQTVLGNIFDEINLYESAKPCIMEICPCFGGDYVLDKTFRQ